MNFLLRLLIAFALLGSCTSTLADNCASSRVFVNPTAAIDGWGYGPGNHRYVNGRLAGLSEHQLHHLRPTWVFALPETDAPRSQPAVTPDTVFIADGDRVVYALDRETGCLKWSFDAGSMVRTALRLVSTPDATLLTFGTLEAKLFAIDAASGREVWQTLVSEHPYAMISGSAAESEGILYQGVSSWEAFGAANPFYACCSFRGEIVAVDAQSGKVLWRAFVIEDEPKVTRTRWLLPDSIGPSGAPVWSQPALDLKRRLLYVGTGENYSSPATQTSDSILAFDLDTGKRLWHRQFTTQDAWNVACVVPGHPNCPEEKGGDLDFGAPPILVTISEKDYLLVGQKNGRVFALDPDKQGDVIWTQKPGSGGKAGGVHFGMAIDPTRGALYVPISDRDVGLLGDSGTGEARPSLHAIDIASGNYLWSVDSPATCMDSSGNTIDGCYRGFSAPPTVAGSLVFAPSLDGVLRVFNAETGAQVWQYDTRKSFAAINGGRAQGGAIDLGGAYVTGGEVFLSSGYGLIDQIPGNAFIAFKIMPKEETLP